MPHLINSRSYKKGFTPWMKGKHHSPESKLMLRLSHLGTKMSEESKAKMRLAAVGRKLSPEHRRKIGESNRRRRLSDVTKKKIGDAHRGKPAPWVAGDKNWNWKGGVNPYPREWTKELTKSIREQDKYICQVCGMKHSIYVHHIDYDKKNCNPQNLITLCIRCHNITTVHREVWKTFFEKLLKKISRKV